MNDVITKDKTIGIMVMVTIFSNWWNMCYLGFPRRPNRTQFLFTSFVAYRNIRMQNLWSRNIMYCVAVRWKGEANNTTSNNVTSRQGANREYKPGLMVQQRGLLFLVLHRFAVNLIVYINIWFWMESKDTGDSLMNIWNQIHWQKRWGHAFLLCAYPCVKSLIFRLTREKYIF